LFEPLTSALRAMREETSAVPDFRSHALDRHAAILRAVEVGDPVQARAAMEAHLQQTEEDLGRYLDPASLGSR
jgi:GntR family transcriptional repressor for pyruvate dehydrogenase complex